MKKLELNKEIRKNDITTISKAGRIFTFFHHSHNCSNHCIFNN